MKFGPICFQSYGDRRGFFFRIFGYGATVCRSKYHVPLFSERIGLIRAVYVLGLRIRLLKPNDF